ncbi:unnamed protein product, partial [Symbiodinium microadriaticum]
ESAAAQRARGSRKSSKKEAADFLGLCPKEITLQKVEDKEPKPKAPAGREVSAPRSSRRPKKAVGEVPNGAYPLQEAPATEALPKPPRAASASRPERSTSRSSRRSETGGRSSSSSKASETEATQAEAAAAPAPAPTEPLKARSTRSTSRRKKEQSRPKEEALSATPEEAEGDRKRSASTRRRRREKALAREASAASMASDMRTEVEEPSREASAASAASVSTEVGRGKPPACKEEAPAETKEEVPPKPKARTVLVSKFQAKHAKLAREGDKKEQAATASMARKAGAMNASDFGKNRLWQGSLSQVFSQETGKPKDSSLEESPKLEILQERQAAKRSQEITAEPSASRDVNARLSGTGGEIAIELSKAEELPLPGIRVEDVKKEALSLACPPPQAEGYESSGTQHLRSIRDVCASPPPLRFASPAGGPAADDGPAAGPAGLDPRGFRAVRERGGAQAQVRRT